MSAPTLFLASSSPRRSQLLTNWSIPFTPIPNLLITEISPPFGTLKHFRKHLKHLAYKKAKLSAKHHQGVILGADTLVIHNHTAFGKPESIPRALEMLSQLSGSRHHVLTAVALYDTIQKISWCFSVCATVEFRKLKKTEIEAYCISQNPTDKAGGYGIQESGNQLIKKHYGSFSTIVGLPKYPLLTYLKYWGITPQKKEQTP